MKKNHEIFPIEYLKSLSWEDTFALAKFSWNNAERLFQAAILLQKNKFSEQAYNNLFIACEEYYKAHSFDGMAYVKSKGMPLNEKALQEFVDNAGNHKWKFREAFFDAEMNIPNITLKVEEGVDDTEIQENLHKEMQEMFDFLDKLNPYDKKNNSLYVGYNKIQNKNIIPQSEISEDVVQRFMQICFYVQITYRVGNTPSGEVSLYLKWSGKDFTDLLIKD